ncbi:MAG: 2-isopropylmalate synthase [Acidimicrobiales bacterium]|jgi:2-isopropylmalate synthase
MTTESRANAAQRTSGMPFERYRSFAAIDIPDRTWPSKVITEAPLWCSVDLRDGNQALIEPMDPERKWKMFMALVDMGFTEIEVGFPSASDTDFQFVREIIEQKAIPEGVKIQVLTQARPELIKRTYEAIDGAPQAIVHLYNSTSTLQRNVVFGLDEDGILDIAVKGAELCRSLEGQVSSGTEILYEYSPESFTGTELQFAKRVCDTVVDVLNPNDGRKTIINLPATVEMSSANIYGDMIEWMHRNLARRDDIILSLHPHNDRGTGVAAAEFGIMAGADRVEGTLFGNGERTGNVDIITLAMNMYSQGVDPMLDISDINELKRVAEHCNQLPVHPRHPYVGELVYTAFSGSHQDAIKKGFEALAKSDSPYFEVPYIPIDPVDVGRSYEDVVRVNSQSGKGGVAYLLKAEQGFDLPRSMQIEFTRVIQDLTEHTGKEVTGQTIFSEFATEYLDANHPYRLDGYEAAQNPRGDDQTLITARMTFDSEPVVVQGSGSGSLDAFAVGLREATGLGIRVLDYAEHAKGTGSDAHAVAYVLAKIGEIEIWGCGMHTDITTASMRAVVSAMNRALAIS